MNNCIFCAEEWFYYKKEKGQKTKDNFIKESLVSDSFVLCLIERDNNRNSNNTSKIKNSGLTNIIR